MLNDDYLWKIRCPESGYIVAECGCMYCFDEYEMDTSEFEYLDEDIEEDDDPLWETEFEFDHNLEDWEDIEDYDE